MDIIKFCGIAIAAVMLILLVKQTREEFSPLMSLAVCIAFFIAAITSFTPVTEYVKEITSGSLLGPYTGTLLKALGIGLVTQTTAEVCRDSGETAVAGKVELLGKTEILLLSLPLMRELLQAASEVMNL